MTQQRLDIGVITLFPDMFRALEYGICGRAQQNGLLNIEWWNPRDFTEDKHRTVDDRPYGGGPGMVMMAEPLYQSIQSAKQQLGADTPVIYLSPQGKPITQARLQTMSERGSCILLAGRYEGIDERVITEAVDEEWSLGDFVLSGGEIAAMAAIDAMTRLLPGALGHDQSAAQDSFAHGLLDYPHFTRPEVWRNIAVPSVLLSGDHKKIARWRHAQALERTRQRRPDLMTADLLEEQENGEHH